MNKSIVLTILMLVLSVSVAMAGFRKECKKECRQEARQCRQEVKQCKQECNDLTVFGYIAGKLDNETCEEPGIVSVIFSSHGTTPYYGAPYSAATILEDLLAVIAELESPPDAETPLLNAAFPSYGVPVSAEPDYPFESIQNYDNVGYAPRMRRHTTFIGNLRQLSGGSLECINGASCGELTWDPCHAWENYTFPDWPEIAPITRIKTKQVGQKFRK